MKDRFLELILLAFDREIIKRLVFSRPTTSNVKKVSARLCAHRQNKVLSLEFSLPGDTVSHKNLFREDIEAALLPLIQEYSQVNLLTTLGDLEYKKSKNKGDVILGERAFISRISNDKLDFERAIESLDKKKSYMLSGKEDFLYKLGISDKNGRVHDKKQGKFRQINRFLEIIDDIYEKLPKEETLEILDLCCGKSYLSFAVYYYFTKIKGRSIHLLGIDLKSDVINYCNETARLLGFSSMHFIADDITKTPENLKPDMVISLHACDLATDIVIDTAIRLSAKIILSTPCCHRYLNDKIITPELKFVTDYPHISNKLCEAITDGIRIARLKKAGYDTVALELTDPENTPKNTLIRAVKREDLKADKLSKYELEYENILSFILGEGKENYLK